MNLNESKEICRLSCQNENLYKHMIAVGIAMRRIAEYLGNKVDEADSWELAGVLHDIDYDETVNDFCKHGRISSARLAECGFSEQICNTVARHPAHADNPPQTDMDWALHIVDPLTGLIIAATFMHPSKKIKQVDTGFVLKRFKEKRFAAGANRDQIALCEEKLGIPLDKFVEITLKAMQEIDDELGL